MALAVSLRDPFSLHSADTPCMPLFQAAPGAATAAGGREDGRQVRRRRAAPDMAACGCIRASRRRLRATYAPIKTLHKL